MNIKIGEKIKLLRQRDGRKQEDLANALGVSPQAVSRWEANGGYPDLGLIPAIANYFNITIDELFGYSKDREEKLKSILAKAEDAINAQGDMAECVEMLRAAAEEFPSEPQVLIKLGYALSMHGWKQFGARSYTTDGSDYAHEDTEYNSKNVYWQEEMRIFEKVLTMDIPPEDRDAITLMSVITYAKMGENDKAKALALKQNSLVMSREILLPHATAAEERDKYQGEAIIALLTELHHVITEAVFTKVSLITSSVGVKLLVDLAQMFESVFSDGNCGIAHTHVRNLYMHAAFREAKYGEGAEKAMEYFEKAFEHHKAYQSIRCQGEYHYTAPLVSKVTFNSENFPAVSEDYWTRELSYMPAPLKAKIQNDPRFAECFR